MKSKPFLVLPLLTLIVLVSCQKDTPDNPEDFLDDRGFITLKINHKLDSSDFSFNTILEDDFGTAYKFTRASIYLSNPTFGNTNMGSYILIIPSETEYGLGRLEAGQYSTLNFKIGVDAIANHSNPVNYDNTHALALQSPSTHWDWNSGYLFIVLEGLYDDDGDDVPNTGFLMHVGSDPLLQSASFAADVTVQNRGERMITLNLNWESLLTGIDILNDHSTHTFNNLPLAEAVANNAPNAFSMP